MPNPLAALATARLLAEAIAPLHYYDLHRLFTDPKVMKTLCPANGQPLSEESIREIMRQAEEHWQQQGFGLWAFHRKKDGQFIGRGGLKYHHIDGKQVVGLAYAVMPDYWNQGFAGEMAQASIEVGFRHLGFPEILSWTLPVNLASQRVMEKLGFLYERDFDFAGLRHRCYRLAAENWKG
jgi:[ribosomal protein S5]-alanine N-acetyltransferase